MGNERVSGPPPSRETRILLVEGDALVRSSSARWIDMQSVFSPASRREMLGEHSEGGSPPFVI
jgi:hypothetical protein